MAAVGRFFPRALIEALERDPAAFEPIALPGTCLFADVSGFTAMSEALLGMGKEGSEVLTKVLNGFYARVVRTVLEHGGDVMRFAGDAVTAHFPEEASAVRAAHAMQAILPDFAEIKTPAGTFTLKMKAGLASGTAVLFTVGDDQQKDYVYSGDPVDGSAEAEHHAQAGQVVLRRGGQFEVLDPPSEGALPAAGLPVQADSNEALRPFLHPMLWEALSSGQEGYLNEHRNITVLFASFQPTGTAAGNSIDAVRNFYLRAVEATGWLDGYINKVDMGDKGSKLLVLFGAPRAHEDDEVRALLCARKLLGAAKETGFSLRMGLNAARVFCGIVGSSERCEYTVMGDGVNVAARLMQVAPEGDFLVSGSIRARALEQFAFRDLPPLTLKGKKEPFPVFKCEGDRGSETSDLSFFVGREQEMDALTKAVEAQPPDRAGLYWIHGEAGVGKTALARHWLAKQFPDRKPIVSRCLSHTAGVPYSAVNGLVRALLADGWEQSGISLAERIREVITRRDPEVAEFVPILLNTYRIGENQRKEPTVEPDVRRSLLWKMTGLLMENVLKAGPIEWLIDGVQWMDVESRALALHLGRMIENGDFKIVVTDRNPPASVEGLLAFSVNVKPFVEEEIQQLMERLLAVAHVPSEAVRKVYCASRGIPLLSRESLDLLFRSGWLARDPEFPEVLLVDESRSQELPDTLSGFVLSQVDALPLVQKAALRTLAVVGLSTSDALVASLAVDRQALDLIVADGRLLARDAKASGYEFSQVNIRDALYESLEFELKRETHLRIAKALQGILRPDHPEYHYELARHLGSAGSVEAIPHLLEVAGRARRDHAIQDAIRNYEKVLAIADNVGEVPTKAVLMLGKLYLMAGQADRAMRLQLSHRNALRTEEHSTSDLILAESYASQGQFHQAEQALRKALDSAVTDLDRFYATCALGKLYGKTGRHEKALENISEAHDAYKNYSDDREYGLNSMRLAFLRFQMGRQVNAIAEFERLRAHFSAVGEVSGLYTITNNLGHIISHRGQYKKAIRLFQDTFGILKRYGFWESEITLHVLMNIGLQYFNMGAFEQARDYYINALAYARKFGSPLLFKPHYLLGEIMLHQGKLKQAADQLHEALALARSNNIPADEILEVLLEMALLMNDRERFAAYFAQYEQAISDNNLGFLASSVENFRAEGHLRFVGILAEPEECQKHLQACLKNEEWPDAYRAARALWASTGMDNYQETIGLILRHLPKRQYHVEFALMQYTKDASPRMRRRMTSLLRKYPFADLQWKANAAMAVRANRQGPKAGYVRRALRITESMLAGLDQERSCAFMDQAEFRRLAELAREIGIPSPA